MELQRLSIAGLLARCVYSYMIMRLLELPPELVRNVIVPFLSLGDIRKVDRSVVAANQKQQLLEILRSTLIPFAVIEQKTFSWLKDREMSVQIVNLGNSVFDEDFVGVEAVMEKCFKLDIFINNWMITSYGLCDLIKGCHRLQSFSFSSDQRIDEKLFSILAANNPDLREFTVAKFEVTDSTLLALAACCPKLENISLRSELISDGAIMQLAEKCNCLVNVDLGSCKYLTDFAVTALVLHCPHLRQLNVEHCEQITDRSLTLLHGLTKLCINECFGVTATGIINVIRNNPELVHLEMVYCAATAGVIASLAEYGNEDMTTLRISNAPVTDAELLPVTAKFRSMQSLDLYSFPRLSDATLVSVAAIMRQLKSLSLVDTPNISDEGIYALVAGCARREAHSFGEGHSVTGAAVVGTTLKYNGGGLKDLVLADMNGLTNATVVHLAQHTSSLSSVCLCFSGISCESVVSLVNNNSSLTRITLPTNLPLSRELATLIEARGVNLDRRFYLRY